MSVYCKELNESFSSKKELFKALKKSKDHIISEKKAQIQKSMEKGLSVTAKPLDYSKINSQNKSVALDDAHYYIAVNSTRILDSHSDVHLDGLWNKTTKEQQGKNYLVDTHYMSLLTTIARKENIEMMTAIVPFAAIGKGYSGETEVLIYKVPKDKIINSVAKEWLESGDAIEASVRMRYTDIVLAMNSDDDDDKEELKNFLMYYPMIANKQDFEEEIFYFWGVKQAQNVSESSLVLFGSNPTTGLLQETKNIEPHKSTQELEKEAAKALQENNVQFYFNT